MPDSSSHGTIGASAFSRVRIGWYPDSQKILVVAGQRGERRLRKIFRAESTVKYYDREKT
jgi:hypothetical protein